MKEIWSQKLWSKEIRRCVVAHIPDYVRQAIVRRYGQSKDEEENPGRWNLFLFLIQVSTCYKGQWLQILAVSPYQNHCFHHLDEICRTTSDL